MANNMKTFLATQTCIGCAHDTAFSAHRKQTRRSQNKYSDVVTRTVVWVGFVAPLMFALPVEAKEGFYLGLGIGGAIVSGESNISVKGPGVPIKGGREVTASTDYASGLAALFRMGYNFFGAAAIEMAFVGHGANLGSDDLEGAGHLNFNVVVHPIGILNLAKVTNIDGLWDPYVLIGGGFSYGSYVAGFDDDDKGWFNADLQTGIGMNIHLAPIVSLGADMRLTVPFGQKWIYDWEDDQEFETRDTSTSLVFTPMFLVTLHIL